MKKTISQIAMLLAVTVAVGCQSGPERPANISASAVPIPIPHGYDWDYCWVDQAMSVNKCRIYNGGGERLYGGVFLRYEGTGAVPANDLKIDVHHGGEAWIQLQNGVILIPESNYVRVKNILDFMNGKRSHP